MRLSPKSRVFVPKSIPLFIRIYFLYVAQLLHEASLNQKSRRRIHLGLPKHTRPLPRSWSPVVLQVEQAIFTGNQSSLTVQGQLELCADPASRDVIDRVRVHGPLASFKNALTVIDYSALNIERLRELSELDPVSPRLFTIAPLLPEFPENVKPRDRVTVTTMYGSPDRGRRGRLRAKLDQDGIEVTNIQNFENYDSAFRDAAILLNFRQVEHFSTPEELRILPALLQRVIVITEDTPFARQSLCADFLVFANEQNLSEVTRQVMDNYLIYWNRLFADRQFSDFVEALREKNHAVAQLAISSR